MRVDYPAALAKCETVGFSAFYVSADPFLRFDRDGFFYIRYRYIFKLFHICLRVGFFIDYTAFY